MKKGTWFPFLLHCVLCFTFTGMIGCEHTKSTNEKNCETPYTWPCPAGQHQECTVNSYGCKTCGCVSYDQPGHP